MLLTLLDARMLFSLSILEISVVFRPSIYQQQHFYLKFSIEQLASSNSRVV